MRIAPFPTVFPQIIMRWWQQLPFSSSSSSKSADILASAASERTGLSSPRRSRARLRQLQQTDADECRSQSYSPHARSPAAEAFAQPLPLPEVQEPKLLTSRSRNVPLPSPGAAARSCRKGEEREKQRLVGESAESPHSNGNTGLSSNSQIPPDKVALRVEDSPPIESPTGAVLPVPPKISSSESPVAWRESASHANVHTLPLPPGADLPSLPIPVSSSSSASDLSGATVSLSPNRIHTLVAVGKHEQMSIKSQWQKGKLIGRGTFGSVYVGSNRETGALCAMKEVEILPEDVKSQERMRQLQQEINVLSSLKHPNIVQYYGSEIVGDKFYIYLEYVHPGSINKFIHDHCAAITESVVRNFTRHILCGLAYLHSTKTIHRDIKGANLLVDAHGVVKLADFGMAKHLNGEAAYLSLKGSPYWLAPELLQPVTPPKDASADLGLAIDIWSLGCTIIEMINGKPPWSDYEGAAALFKVLKETPPIPETLSAEGKDFLQCCFRRNPADRPTAVKLLDHPFVDCTRSTSLLSPPGHVKR